MGARQPTRTGVPVAQLGSGPPSRGQLWLGHARRRRHRSCSGCEAPTASARRRRERSAAHCSVQWPPSRRPVPGTDPPAEVLPSPVERGRDLQPARARPHGDSEPSPPGESGARADANAGAGVWSLRAPWTRVLEAVRTSTEPPQERARVHGLGRHRGERLPGTLSHEAPCGPRAPTPRPPVGRGRNRGQDGRSPAPPARRREQWGLRGNAVHGKNGFPDGLSVTEPPAAVPLGLDPTSRTAPRGCP